MPQRHPLGTVGRVTWTIEQVVALAPTPARYAAGEGLAVPSRWLSLGVDDRSAWGRCRGSGREPYETMVDHAHAAWRCSCPSRSQPCKHALALLVMWVRGQVPAAVAPPGVTGWVDGHVPRERSGSGAAPAIDDTLPANDPEQVGIPTPPSGSAPVTSASNASAAG